MAISYPLALPTVTGIRSVDIRAVNAVAYSQSPFTFIGQAHAYQGQMWQAEITLPAMNRSTAETWIAFLLSLRGQFGTFLLGDPRGCALRGTATSCTITGSAGDNTVSATVTSSLAAARRLRSTRCWSTTLAQDRRLIWKSGLRCASTDHRQPPR
jgi:hypothetical protein